MKLKGNLKKNLEKLTIKQLNDLFDIMEIGILNNNLDKQERIMILLTEPKTKLINAFKEL
jgi:hypothetical protein